MCLFFYCKSTDEESWLLRKTVDCSTALSSSLIRSDMQCFATGAYLQQLHDKYKRLRCSHYLIQLWVTCGVIVEHVSHATHVPLALQGVFPLSDQPHSLGHDGVQACVLQNKLINKNINNKTKEHLIMLTPWYLAACDNQAYQEHISNGCNFTCKLHFFSFFSRRQTQQFAEKTLLCLCL